MSKFQKTAKTIFLFSAALFVAVFLLATGESPFLVVTLLVAFAVFFFTVDRVVTRARLRQGKDHEIFVTASDYSHLSRNDWLSVLLAMFSAIAITAICVKLFGRGA